jgi:menaquinone-dependent protoporphyrinogen oxidase
VDKYVYLDKTSRFIAENSIAKNSEKTGRVLIVYGTTEGQTRKIAEHVAGCLRAGDHDVGLYDSARPLQDLEVTNFDAVVVVASIHQQVHQESVTNFVRTHLAQLTPKPTLFVSVSLSAAFDEGKRDAMGYVDQFIADAGWRPTQTLLVAGALRYSQYDYYEEQIIEHLVLKGREITERQGDCELTDWDGLSRDVEAFMRSTLE